VWFEKYFDILNRLGVDRECAIDSDVNKATTPKVQAKAKDTTPKAKAT